MQYPYAPPNLVSLCALRGFGAYPLTDPIGDGSSKFVKYCDSRLFPEARTQQYIANLANLDAVAPGVPQVEHVFIDDHGGVYLVMEYIPLNTFRPWVERDALPTDERNRRLQVAAKAIAAALSWLMMCPLPVCCKLGPIGGGRMQHDFFRKEEAPLEFPSVEALEKYVNKARIMLLSSMPFINLIVGLGIKRSSCANQANCQP